MVSLVLGSLSRRLVNRPAGRGYLTLKIPEPGVLAAPSANIDETLELPAILVGR